jgi:tetratricopeptide (TPR) repeat protein
MTRKIIFFSLCYLLSSGLFAQPTYFVTNPTRKFQEAEDLMIKKQYALAYPLFRELKESAPAVRRTDMPYVYDDIHYYDMVCRLNLQMGDAAEEAKLFIHTTYNIPRVQLLSFHLGHYYFSNDEFSEGVEYFSKAGNDNLTNEQIADKKFELGYCYFNLKDFENAGPLFNEVCQMPDHKYYSQANYYYGFISYSKRDYGQALEAFKKIVGKEEYRNIVPYYIVEIYYFQGRKDEAIKYADEIMKGDGQIYYKDQLQLLTGQMYFEKQDYSKALPLLDEYVSKSPKVSKEVLYQQSYANYKAGNFDKAIAGFKELSNEKDSMGQNSMYLLGDLYLRKGQKENARNAFQYSAFNSANASQQQEARLQYAKLSYELGYQDVALKEIKSYLKDYPDSKNEAEAREILFGLLANSNDYREAYELYNSVASPTPAMRKILPRILYGRSVELINDQQTSKALDLLRRLVSDSNAGKVLPYGQFWLGELYYRNGAYDESIRNTNLFLAVHPAAQGEVSVMAANYNLGYAWFQKESYKQAAGYFDQVAPSMEASSVAMVQDAWVRKADCYYMMKDFAKANALYDKVIAGALPQADHALYQKAMMAGVKNGSEKVRLLESLKKQYPQSPLVRDVDMEAAVTYMADEKYAEAIPYLNRVIESGDAASLPKAYLKLGLAQYNNNNNDQALSAFEHLLSKYPNSAETDEAIGVIKDIYVEEGRPGDFVDMMNKNGIRISVNEADSLSFVSGRLKYENDDCAAAVKAFENYLVKYPSGSFVLDALFMKSDCYRRSKEWNKALEGYSAVSGRGPSPYFDRATLEAARISYFEQKNYSAARQYFELLSDMSTNPENRQEALRGLVRCYYQLKDYSKAKETAALLLEGNGVSTDDKAIATLLIGKSQQMGGDCSSAITSFKTVASLNRSSWGAEARYEMASCYFSAGDLNNAESAAISVIKETGAFDLWVTKAYILIGDIFMQQKDYFNAKATYESVARNAAMPDLKAEAQQKLDKAIEAEKSGSRLSN